MSAGAAAADYLDLLLPLLLGQKEGICTDEAVFEGKRAPFLNARRSVVSAALAIALDEAARAFFFRLQSVRSP